MGLIQQYRAHALPELLTPSALCPFGISQGNAPRALQALRFLGLIDDVGRSTESFKRLRQASAEEYPDTFAEIVRAAYRPIFSLVDPGQDDLAAVDEAFRRYTPADQRDHMVRLFMSPFTSASFLMPTQELADMTQPVQSLYGLNTTNNGRIIIFAGGIPLMRKREVAGAIGVSGGTVDQDQEVAEADVAAFE